MLRMYILIASCILFAVANAGKLKSGVHRREAVRVPICPQVSKPAVCRPCKVPLTYRGWLAKYGSGSRAHGRRSWARLAHIHELDERKSERFVNGKLRQG